MESILESIFVNQYTFLHMSLSIFCWIILPIVSALAVISIISGFYYFMDGPIAALALIGIGVACGLLAWFMITAGISNYERTLVDTAFSLLHIAKSM